MPFTLLTSPSADKKADPEAPRLLGEAAVERGGRRELEHEPPAFERGRAGLGQHRVGGDRALGDGGEDRLAPCGLDLRELVVLEQDLQSLGHADEYA